MSLQIDPKIKVIAVSKLQSTEKIKKLIRAGYTNFGENYVQEALPKIEELKSEKINWHFIGKLQKNKAKLVVGKFHLIQSVDSLDLAKVIDKQAQNKNLIQDVLLQVNVANEESKNGFSMDELKADLTALIALKNIKICGLMTMPPLSNQPNENQPFFKKLRQLQSEYKSVIPSLSELSMGTSHDYQIAIQEGATMIRLGTILFGARPSNT